MVEQLDDAAGRPLLPHWGLASHPCWYVDDMEAAVAGLREVGMAAENAIVDRFAHERGEQSTYIHFDSPWGMDLELISNPLPVAYELEGAPLVYLAPDAARDLGRRRRRRARARATGRGRRPIAARSTSA